MVKKVTKGLRNEAKALKKGSGIGGYGMEQRKEVLKLGKKLEKAQISEEKWKDKYEKLKQKNTSNKSKK